MGGLGISDYSSLFQNYNIPSIPDIRIGQTQQSEQQLPKISEEPQGKTVITEEEPIQKKAGKSADLENISLKFNTGDD